MAARLLKTDRDAVSAMVDDGRLRWAFDLAPVQGRNRLLRILAAEVDPGGNGMAGLAFDEIMAPVFGAQRGRVRNAEVAAACMLPRVTTWRWVRVGEVAGEQAGHTLWLSRHSLLEFFRRRLVGAAVERRAIAS